MTRRAGMAVEIGFDSKTRAALRILPQLGARLRELRRWMLYQMVEGAQRGVLDYMPNTKAVAGYRKALRVSRVLAGGQLDAFAIHVDQKSSGVRTIDPRCTVVFIRVKRRRLVRPPPQVAVLQRYSPWTLDTLPFLPTRREAMIVSREVSAKEAHTVGQERRAEEKEWRAELTRVGSRTLPRKDRLVFPKAPGSAVPDVAFEALRLEFGMGGARAVPHWRPAIRDAPRALLRSTLQRRGDVVRLLTQPSFTGWRRWVPRLHPLRPAEARKFVAFQQRLHLKSGGPPR